jgi:hypothetical protein
MSKKGDFAALVRITYENLDIKPGAVLKVWDLDG